MPRIVGYQRSFGMFSVGCAWARSDVITMSGPRASQTPLVVDDRLDLLLRQHVAEMRHAARGDAARPVQLVGGLAVRDPVDLVRYALRARELSQRLAAGQVRAECAATLRTGQRARAGLVRIEERPVLGVAAGALELEEQRAVARARVLRLGVRELAREPLLGLLGRELEGLDVVHQVLDPLLVEHALPARDAPRGHRRPWSAVRDDVVDLVLGVPQQLDVQGWRLPRDLHRQAVARRVRGDGRGRVAAGVVGLQRVVGAPALTLDAVTVRAQQ